MQRKPLFLAASIAELLRFLAIFFLADSLGVLRMGVGAPSLFRYAASPQLLFAAALFFLWYDYGRYEAYRPLLAAGKAVSLLVLLPLALRLALSQLGAMSDFVLLGFAALVDIGVLLLASLKSRAVEATPPQVESHTGPRGPEDIEKVEG
jgi:hypothetical protein